MPLIVLIEDDQDIRELIQLSLTARGYQLICFEEGQEPLLQIKEKKIFPDLLLVDQMLPNISGKELIKEIRKTPSGKSVPILVVTALAQKRDILEGFEIGADDYLTKPFDLDVLEARVKALLKRSPKKRDQIIVKGNLQLDRLQSKAKVREKDLWLTKTEAKILEFFLLSDDIPLSREEIKNAAIGVEIIVGPRVIDTHLASLRKKLKDWSHNISTIRGIGFKIEEKKPE